MAQQEDEWFSMWSDSPYYHILYRNRDLHEAHLSADRLLAHLLPNPHKRIPSLACGRGRHSLYISLTGIAPARRNAHASQSSSASLHAGVYDTRHLYIPAYPDFFLSLFASLAHFNNGTGNVAALAAMGSSLEPGGPCGKKTLQSISRWRDGALQQCSATITLTYSCAKTVAARMIFALKR